MGGGEGEMCECVCVGRGEMCEGEWVKERVCGGVDVWMCSSGYKWVNLVG